MELDADEPRMVRTLDDFGKLAIGAHPAEDEAALLQRLAIMHVHFVAMAVALADRV